MEKDARDGRGRCIRKELWEEGDRMGLEGEGGAEGLGGPLQKENRKGDGTAKRLGGGERKGKEAGVRFTAHAPPALDFAGRNLALQIRLPL